MLPMMAGRVVMIGKDTTIERLSEATNQPICAHAQIPPERNAGTASVAQQSKNQGAVLPERRRSEVR